MNLSLHGTEMILFVLAITIWAAGPYIAPLFKGAPTILGIIGLFGLILVLLLLITTIF